MTAKALFENPTPDPAPLSSEQLEHLIELQSAMLSATVSDDNYNILLEQLCQFAEKLTEQAVASIMLLDAEQNTLHVLAAPSIPEQAINELNGLRAGEGSCGNALFHNEDMYVCNTLKDRRWENLHSFAETYQVNACWSSPIRDQHGNAIGSFALSSFSPREPDNFQRRLLNSCASIASIILQRKQAAAVRLQHETELLHSQQRYHSILENSADAISLVDRLGNFIDANQAAYEKLGYSRDEYLSMNVADVETEPGPGSFEQFFDQLPFNEKISLEGRLQRKDGSRFPVDIRLRKFISDDTPMLVVSTTDISERKQAEEESLRASKLESVGLLAGGIAHDFNNLLGIILGHIDLASMRIDADNQARLSLDKARKALARATDLTQQLLTFSKGGDPLRKVYDIREIFEEAVDFSTHGSNVTCHMECQCSKPLALVDRGQISQVVQNLVINARQAMQDGGELHIIGNNMTVDELHPHSALQPGNYLRITFTDTGGGIPEDIIKSIFDPYFTTKQNGNGLGLALTYSILKKHGGHIEVENIEGKGACFTIYLPAASKEADQTCETGNHTGQQSVTAKVLLMDDDAMIREIARTMLEESGCDVFEAEEGEAAVELYRQAADNNAPFDLVIMDLTVPNGMGGKQAMKHIKEFDPQARGLVSSGYSNDPVMANHKQYGFNNAVSKPYTQQDLIAAVRQALSA